MTKEALKKAGVGTDKVILVLDHIHTVIVDPKQGTCNFNDDLIFFSGYNGWEYSRITEVMPYQEFTNLQPVVVTFGSDPELFVVEKSGDVIPSPAVVGSGVGIVKPDGFQIELNPTQHTCRQSSASFICDALITAREMAQKRGYDLSFKVGHTITDSVWKKVSITLKRFGCHPTMNVHERAFKRVTGLREKFRAGGGHIHLGTSLIKESNVVQMVTLMDIICGNTCVMLDRDPDNARRRINYGRAGEYRLKSYGLEYRVLSNFWLKKYLLWSTASVLLRQSIQIGINPKLAEELISRMNIKDVRDAINNNDKELAIKNFNILRAFIKEKKITYGSGLNFLNVDAFFDWASEEDPVAGLNVDTVDKVLTGWSHRGDNFHGLEQFLSARRALMVREGR